MSKKPSFANLGSRLAAKPVEVATEPRASATEPAREPEAAVSGTPARQADGRKGILVRARPEAWKALKLVALDRERTLQDVMTEAINDVLTKHGKPPVA
ncbi:ribbon-helix-helix domain-containing protein [Methylobacterium sp. WL120]|uniref:ribbon-helix-helix domain-containing protein n=1 Tax=Methylobacterium sp. WL120 TaxID=2603887 RepID=UPI0011C775D2|nr:ribbon-helix-helix domain-containing protein [Methylobacterium sp. WL120]TXM58306.1 hypothetical protein FV229_25285 [Methylobacterium sp. WL120]